MIYHPTLLSALVVDILSMPIFLCLTKLVLCQNSDEIDENTDQSTDTTISTTTIIALVLHSELLTLLPNRCTAFNKTKKESSH